MALCCLYSVRVDVLATLGRTLGFSFAAGVNLYATVALVGLAARYHWVQLPEQFAVFDNNWVIGLAIGLYIVEFIADKIPWVDSVWDAVHTAIRPAGAALIAVASIGITGVLVIVFSARWLLRRVRARFRGAETRQRQRTL